MFQERTGNNSFEHNALTLKYKLDNEFELVFVVAYQKILQLSYVDKFLNDIHLEFRDMYKTELQEGLYFQVGNICNVRESVVKEIQVIHQCGHVDVFCCRASTTLVVILELF